MAAASTSLGEQISEELSCSICLEQCTRPKVLPCQHTFCQDCLQDYTRGKKRFQCPNCRQQGVFVHQFPTEVPGVQKEMSPSDVALDGEGNPWVVGRIIEPGAEFLVQYTKQGRILRKTYLQETEHGTPVNAEDGTWMDWFTSLFWQQNASMKSLKHVTVDREGNILVSDCGNHCVYVFSEDRQFLFKFGGWGSRHGQLKSPRGVCTDKAGNIIVADSGNSRVEIP
ncbi:uncharacterized protein [Branchiostoma lanceolatum]|uniref:uncharacterized protein n=1 Tax=Branchiostoma lanceolatum TaxID=7740 RepID=UPI00345714EA